MKHFKKEKVYPNEAYIQEAIENFFTQEGFIIDAEGQIDLIAEKNDDKWIIEAKGMTSQITVDFNTCIGQLAKSMKSDSYNYGIALPYEDKYKKQCLKLPKYFREKNNLSIIVVNEKQEVIIIGPAESIDKMWK